MGPAEEEFEGRPGMDFSAARPTANIILVDLSRFDGLESMMEDLGIGVGLAGSLCEGDCIFNLANEVSEGSIGVIGEANTTIVVG